MERKERDRNFQKKIEDWKNKSRFEKIREIKENAAINNNKLSAKLSPATINPPSPKKNQYEDQAEQCQAEQQN